MPTPSELRRREQRRRILRQMAYLVLGPTLLSAIYFAVIAPPAYTSQMEFTIRGRLKPAPDILAGLGLPGGSSTANDAHVVADYIQSPMTIRLLKAQYGFDKAYSRFTLDPTAYLPKNAPIEWVKLYWSQKIKADYDSSGDTTTVSVIAYTPEDALHLAEGVLAAGNAVEDELNAKVQQGSYRLAVIQVAVNKKQYDAAKKALADLQGNVNTLNITSDTSEAVAIVGNIDSQLATLKVSQAGLDAAFKPTSPQTRAVQTQITTLEAERAREIAKAKSAPGIGPAEHDIKIQAALLDYQFAQKAYFAAQDALLAAEPQSQDKNFLVPFIQPTKPELSDYWVRFLDVIGVFLAASLLFGVGALGYSVIKDHMQ